MLGGVKDDDNFISELRNLGWLLRFAHAIDSSVMQFLERAYGTTQSGGQRAGGSKENDMFPGAVTMDIIPESILVDSGAQVSCVRESAMDMIVHVN